MGYVALGSVLKAFCKGQAIDKAVQYLKQLPAEQVTRVMYGTILSTCATKGKASRVKGTLTSGLCRKTRSL